jgi:hypothetical protein
MLGASTTQPAQSQEPGSGVLFWTFLVVAIPAGLIWFLQAPSGAGSGGSAFTLVVLLGLGYFLPPVIAGLRGHHQAGAIFILTLFLGWTVLGWIAALVWSFTATRKN